MEENQNFEQHTKFNSALPLILKLRDLIFGETKPDIYTRITVYFNAIIWFIFLAWHLIGYASISMREVIFTEKKIDVEALIFERGKLLRFEPYEFLNLLLKYHLISSICWGTIFIGLILIWRKSRIFNYFIFIPLLVYAGMILFFLRWRYLMEDTTTFDKITLLVFVLNILIYWFIQRAKRQINI
jgi:hypothetical protein